MFLFFWVAYERCFGCKHLESAFDVSIDFWPVQ